METKKVVVGLVATGCLLFVGTQLQQQSPTLVDQGAQFVDLVVDHTLDGTPGDNVQCICEEGYEANEEFNNCTEINPCSDDSTNECSSFTGSCYNWPPPAEYDPGYQCDCFYGHNNTNNDQECEPVPCETLTIEHSQDCIAISGVNPNEHVSCICEDGYGPDSTFTMDCEPVGEARSDWLHEKTCLPIPCPNLDVSNSNYLNLDTGLKTTEKTIVMCQDGFEVSTGGCSFEAVCTAQPGAVVAWRLGNGDFLPSCVPVECGPVSIDHSTADGDQEGLVTGNFLTVTCDDGYKDLNTGSFEFTMECVPGPSCTNSWTGNLPCEPVPCGQLTVLNSENPPQDYLDDVESPTRFITCESGFEPSQYTDGGQDAYGGNCYVERDCDPVLPGNAAYNIDGETCVRVECDQYTTDNVLSSTPSTSGDGTQEQTDLCDFGFGTASSGGDGSYFLECLPAGPCARTWDAAPSCVPVLCDDLFSENSRNFATPIDTGAVTNDSRTVECADGYETSSGECSYIATCVGTAPNENTWTHADACQLIPCPNDISIDYTTTTTVTTEVTFDSITVSCIDGYWDSDTNLGNFDLYCDATPCANEWIHEKDCTPKPCPDLTVPNTNVFQVPTGANIVDSRRTATCQAGYAPNTDAGGCSVERICDTNGPAHAYWTGDENFCSPLPCVTSELDDLDRSDVSESNGFTATVVCDPGFAAAGTGSTTYSCNADAPCEVSWDPEVPCECVDCPAETFAFSDHASIGISGCTEESDTVNCDPGYCASGSVSFTATCSGTAPAEVTWIDTDTCAPSSCGILNKANSDTTTFEGVTGTEKTVTCLPGCHSQDCTSVIITCEAKAPCSSEWDHQDFECVCPDDAADAWGDSLTADDFEDAADAWGDSLTADDFESFTFVSGPGGRSACPQELIDGTVPLPNDDFCAQLYSTFDAGYGLCPTYSSYNFVYCGSPDLEQDILNLVWNDPSVLNYGWLAYVSPSLSSVDFYCGCQAYQVCQAECGIL
jgi:hypothetical protein